MISLFPKGGLPKTGYIRPSPKKRRALKMRPLSPASAIIANDLIDNGLADPHSPDQEIADTVNWRRTQHGQDALTQLGEMAPPWRRRVLPADPTPYRIQEIRQHRLHRASTSMQSAPPAPPPAVALSGELAFDPMDFLDIPDTPISASSAPAFQEVANQSELSVPAGESVDCPAIAPSIELFPWRWTLSRPFTFSFIDSQFVHACDGHAGYRQHGKGPTPRPSLTGSRLEHGPANSQIHAGRAQEGDRPGNGETVSKAALAKRKKVIDPETGKPCQSRAGRAQEGD
ncbi:hypothetical protein [Xanthomonas citri]|uniref:hypothetical protein n=1 Tax=Xanthomonas citri TaxID=346 RepID=UPI00159B8BF9|nr:hypothetical protein [Xanthomonas citri]